MPRVSGSARALRVGGRASLPSGAVRRTHRAPMRVGAGRAGRALLLPLRPRSPSRDSNRGSPESAGFNRDNPTRKLSEHFNGQSSRMRDHRAQHTDGGSSAERAPSVPRPRLSSPGHPAARACLPGGTKPQAPRHGWTGSMRTPFPSLAPHSPAGRMETLLTRAPETSAAPVLAWGESSCTGPARRDTKAQPSAWRQPRPQARASAGCSADGASPVRALGRRWGRVRPSDRPSRQSHAGVPVVTGARPRGKPYEHARGNTSHRDPTWEQPQGSAPGGQTNSVSTTHRSVLLPRAGRGPHAPPRDGPETTMRREGTRRRRPHGV